MKPVLIAVAVATLGCSKQQDAAPEAKRAPPEIHDLGKKFRGCWEAWSAGKAPELGACYAESAVSESPGAGFPPATKVGEILVAAQGFKAAFPDVEGMPQLVLINETKIAAVVRLSGTKPETKKPFGLLGGVVDNFDASGRITHEADYFDALTIQGQLDPQPAHLVRAWNATMSLVPQTIVAKHDAAEQANVGVVKAMIEAFRKHDVAAFAALIPEDGTWSDAAERADWTKAELLVDRAAGFAGFPDLEMKTQDLWGAGEFVVDIGELTGTNDGPMPGIATPTHKRITVPFFAIHRVVAGKLAHTWVFQQASAFVTQLGLK